MVRTQLHGAAQSEYEKAVRTLQSALASGIVPGTGALQTHARKLGTMLDKMQELTENLESALNCNFDAITNCHHQLRMLVDDLELLVNDSDWPLPKYREMLFVY